MSTEIETKIENLSVSELKELLSSRELYSPEVVAFAENSLNHAEEQIHALSDTAKIQLQTLSTDELKHMLDQKEFYQENTLIFVREALYQAKKSAPTRATDDTDALSPPPAVPRKLKFNSYLYASLITTVILSVCICFLNWVSVPAAYPMDSGLGWTVFDMIQYFYSMAMQDSGGAQAFGILICTVLAVCSAAALITSGVFCFKLFVDTEGCKKFGYWGMWLSVILSGIVMLIVLLANDGMQYDLIRLSITPIIVLIGALVNVFWFIKRVDDVLWDYENTPSRLDSKQSNLSSAKNYVDGLGEIDLNDPMTRDFLLREIAGYETDKKSSLLTEEQYFCMRELLGLNDEEGEQQA